VFGFAIYILSTVASLIKFGLLVSLTLVLGLCVEYLMTPAVLLVLNRYRLLGTSSIVATAQS
jgi:predicted RND superfamily exporter protein